MGINNVCNIMPLTLEDLFTPIPVPGGNPLTAGTPGTSTMDTLGGAFPKTPEDRTKQNTTQTPPLGTPYISLAPEDPLEDFFNPAPALGQKKPSQAAKPAEPAAQRASGRVSMGWAHGIHRRHAAPTTLHLVLQRLGITAASDPEAALHAQELHDGCLDYLRLIQTDTGFLSQFLENADVTVLNSLNKSGLKLFTLTPDEEGSMKRIFRALAQKYHSDSKQEWATPDRQIFSRISTAWKQVKELYGW